MAKLEKLYEHILMRRSDSNVPPELLQVRTYLEERMRTHLRKRHKVRDRKTGYIRFPRQDLYEKYGLYKVPATAGWDVAHALR